MIGLYAVGYIPVRHRESNLVIANAAVGIGW